MSPRRKRPTKPVASRTYPRTEGWPDPPPPSTTLAEAEALIAELRAEVDALKGR